MDKQVNPDHKMDEAAQLYDVIFGLLNSIPKEELSLDTKLILIAVKTNLKKMNLLISEYLDEVETMVVDINKRLG